MKEKDFEIIDEGSARRAVIYGKNLERLFEHALLCLVTFLKPEAARLKRNQMKEAEEIDIHAVDLNSLLVDFLIKVNELSDTKNSVFPYIMISRLGENFLEGKIFGVKVGEFAAGMHGISYESVDVRKNNATGNYEVTLVFEL